MTPGRPRLDPLGTRHVTEVADQTLRLGAESIAYLEEIRDLLREIRDLLKEATASSETPDTTNSVP